MQEPTEPTWRPLFTDPAQIERVRTVVTEVAAATAAWPLDGKSLDAHCDRAILRTYLSQDGGFADEADEGGAHLSTAITIFGEGGFPASLFSGAGKVGWSVAHLAGGDEAEEVCRAIDQAMMRRLEESPWESDYDLIIGLVGMGVYALERGEAPSGRALAVRILEQLESTAVERGGGLAWHTGPKLLPDWQRAISPEGYWNLGLAHGNPGVAALLARMIAAGVEPVRARRLLDGSMAFLLGAEPFREGGRYPSWHPAGDETGSTRLAWCYGDLGAAIALLSAALVTGNARWRDEAVELGRLCATRTFEQAHVWDAGLCHGTCSAVQIFNRMWQATGEPVFGDVARAWVEQTLRIRNSEPIAGFPQSWKDDKEPDRSWQPDDGLLTGSAGVALTLHATISEVEPLWDRILLTDLPVGAAGAR